MKLSARSWILAGSLGLAACGALTETRDQYWLGNEGPRFPSVIDSLTAYHTYAWRLTTAEWPRENDLARDAAAHDLRLFQRIRQAMLAAAPAAPHAEHLRAQQLLEQCERDAANDPSLKSFIVLLRDELAERRRLEERVRDEGRRADLLDQKLGELKDIELRMLDRARPIGARKP